MNGHHATLRNYPPLPVGEHFNLPHHTKSDTPVRDDGRTVSNSGAATSEEVPPTPCDLGFMAHYRRAATDRTGSPCRMVQWGPRRELLYTSVHKKTHHPASLSRDLKENYRRLSVCSIRRKRQQSPRSSPSSKKTLFRANSTISKGSKCTVWTCQNPCCHFIFVNTDVTSSLLTSFGMALLGRDLDSATAGLQCTQQNASLVFVRKQMCT